MTVASDWLTVAPSAACYGYQVLPPTGTQNAWLTRKLRAREPYLKNMPYIKVYRRRGSTYARTFRGCKSVYYGHFYPEAKHSQYLFQLLHDWADSSEILEGVAQRRLSGMEQGLSRLQAYSLSCVVLCHETHEVLYHFIPLTTVSSLRRFSTLFLSSFQPCHRKVKTTGLHMAHCCEFYETITWQLYLSPILKISNSPFSFYVMYLSVL